VGAWWLGAWYTFGFFGVWIGSVVGEGLVEGSGGGFRGEFRIVLTLVLVGDSIGWFRMELGVGLGLGVELSLGVLTKLEEDGWELFIGFFWFSELEFIGFNVG
jgi:hypothetical protein